MVRVGARVGGPSLLAGRVDTVVRVQELPIVVGAGAAGLAVAASLRLRGVDCVVLERASSVGSSWSARYDSLHLHTVRWLSGLPGTTIPRRYGRWVARDDLVAYLADHAARHGIEPVFGTQVNRIERLGDRWRVETSGGVRHAPAVVVATGFSSRPCLPDWAAAVGAGLPRVEHSATYPDPGPYRGRRVVVVGAGNSGSEIAVDLARAGVDVSVSVRRPPDIVRRSVLGVPGQLLGIAVARLPERLVDPVGAALRRVSVGDLGAFGLRTPSPHAATRFRTSGTVPILDHGFVREVRAGRVRVLPAVESLVDGGVCVTGGRTVPADVVICATGYRPGLEPLVGHLGVLDERGTPEVNGAATSAGAPGLYFCGMRVQLTGLLRGIGAEARAIAHAVAVARPAADLPG